jgi:hypothetical protein
MPFTHNLGRPLPQPEKFIATVRLELSAPTIIEGCDKLTKVAHVLDACVEIEAWEFTSVVKKN